MPREAECTTTSISSAITFALDVGGGRGPVILQGGVLVDHQSQGGQRVDTADLGAQIA